MERWMVVAILLTYGTLALSFSLGPIFEGPDEIEHYRYARTLIESRALPDPMRQVRGEYHQAPLYYLLVAPVAALITDTDFDAIDGRLNPYYGARIEHVGNDNKNLYLHRRAEAFPYDESATARAVHLMRLVSVAIGAGTLLVSRAIFRLLWPGQPALRVLALALVAFWPQFLYLSSVINNDTLLIFLATVTLYWLLVLLRDGPSRRVSVLLGVTLGALLLTKVSAVFVAFPVGVVLLPDRRTWRCIPLIGVLVIAVAGWWYTRNAILYGDLTNTQAVLQTWEAEVIRPGELALDIALERVPFAYETAWARFGQGAVPVASTLYGLFDALLIAAGAGLLLRRVWRGVIAGPDMRYAAMIGLFAAIWIGALFYTSSIWWSGNQGRYLLPGIAAWSAMIAYGVSAWLPRRAHWAATWVGTFTLGAVAAICLLAYFLPAYRVSPAPETITYPLAYTFEDTAELIGIDPPQLTARPGDTAQITLYWRAIRSADRDLLVYLHSIDSGVVRRDSHPGTGNLLATDWRAGETWAEHYTVEIPANAPQQTVHPLVAGLYDPRSAQPLPAINATGEIVTPLVGSIGISGPEAGIDPAYTFGSRIGAEAPQVTRQGDQVAVCVRWGALGRVTTDYTVFVHVLDTGIDPMPQIDAPPPYPTGMWVRGEAVDHCMTLTIPGLPDEGWYVALGLYDAGTGQRLPVRDSHGATRFDDRVVIHP